MSNNNIPRLLNMPQSIVFEEVIYDFIINKYSTAMEVGYKRRNGQAKKGKNSPPVCDFKTDAEFNEAVNKVDMWLMKEAFI